MFNRRLVLCVLCLFGLSQAQITVSGTVTKCGVPQAGVPIYYSATLGDTVNVIPKDTTDAQGKYLFWLSPATGNTVFPKISGHTFTPAYSTFNSTSLNKVFNFSASYFVLSGHIYDRLGAGMAVAVRCSIPGVKTLSTTSAADGSYSFSDAALSCGANVVITPTKPTTQYAVTPAAAASFSISGPATNDFTMTQTFSVYGQVDVGGGDQNSGLEGLTITLTPTSGSPITTTTYLVSGHGSYNAQVPYGWSGTVSAPTVTGIAYVPGSTALSNVTAGQYVVFTYWLQTTGVVRDTFGVPIPGATVTASTPGIPYTATTASDGSYSVTVRRSSTVSVTKAGGYVFTARGMSNVMADQVFNFTEKAYSIPGTVRVGAVGLQGVLITYSNGGGTTTTNASGQYSRLVNSHWLGSVTASLTGYTFNPASWDFTEHLTTNWPARDFAATVLAPTGIPTLLNPTAAATDVPVTVVLTWSRVTGATGYGVHIGTKDTTATDTALSVTLANGTGYWWRVRAANAGGDGSWSDSIQFTTIVAAPGTVSLIDPAVDAVDVPVAVTLRWSSVAGSTGYTVKFDGHDTVVADTVLPVSGLVNASAHTWQVQAVNAGGSGPWSAARSFTTIVAVPGSVTLLAPTDNVTSPVDSVRLVWGSMAGATKYRVEVATDTGFLNLFLSDTTLTDTARVVKALANHTAYYWRVSAANVAGWGTWSVRRKVTVTLPSTGTVPRLAAIRDFSVGLDRYFVPVACDVSVRYYDAAGRVSASYDGYVGAGTHLLRAPGSCGRYVRVFRAGSFYSTGAVVVVR